MLKRTNKKGFTLVELVIVLAVLAIIAAIAIPAAGAIMSDANKRADASNAEMYNNAIQLHYAANGAYPADAAAARTAITTYSKAKSVSAPKQGGLYVYNPTTGEVTITGSAISGTVQLNN